MLACAFWREHSVSAFEDGSKGRKGVGETVKGVDLNVIIWIVAL